MIHWRREKLQKKGGVMKKEISRIERRVAVIKSALAKLGDMRPGSLSVQSRKWGGEYCQLSYTHRGKGHTELSRKRGARRSRGRSPITANFEP
jgi:hypothetical protein